MGNLLFILAIALIWFFPVFMVITSGKTSSREKIAWVLAIIFISWFAWVIYLLLAPLKKKD